MNGLYYILDKENNVIEAEDFDKWSKYFESTCKNDGRRVSKDEVNGSLISTVFLGISHSYCDTSEPLIFETMVFEPGITEDRYLARYCTWNEALKGHAEAIEWVLNGCKEDEINY